MTICDFCAYEFDGAVLYTDDFGQGLASESRLVDGDGEGEGRMVLSMWFGEDAVDLEIFV